jgi:SAM-dependent methyltransferase
MRLNRPSSKSPAAADYIGSACCGFAPEVKAAASSEAKNQTIVACDRLAERYDDLFSRSRIGTQRGAVWEALADTFRPGDQILELNCGTGENALFLALYGISVVACDASEGMIQTARHRMQALAPGAPIQFELLHTEHLSKLRPGALFDGVLANFSGMNCVADLKQTARDLASLVAMGAPVLVCLSTRFCLSETLWFLLDGRVGTAFRRSSAIATVKVGDCAVKVHYPALKEVRKSFSPSFLMCSCTGIGVAVPPSYLEPIFRRYPRVLGLLRLLDRGISRLPLFRTTGDHMLVHFERVER